MREIKETDTHHSKIAAIGMPSPYPLPVGLLAHSSMHQVEVLSYADCFLFMAVAGVIAMCLIPVMPPFLSAQKK
jgi:hypothetical protein